jgi:hypothetical protein
VAADAERRVSSAAPSTPSSITLKCAYARSHANHKSGMNADANMMKPLWICKNASEIMRGIELQELQGWHGMMACPGSHDMHRFPATAGCAKAAAHPQQALGMNPDR